MNKKLILAIAALMIVALSVVAFAYTRGTATGNKAAMSCSCCHGDSCPMKSQKSASTGEKASCDCDCCRDGKMAGMDGDSCPMHKAENASATAGAKTSCDCSCCNHNKETAAAPAV